MFCSITWTVLCEDCLAVCRKIGGCDMLRHCLQCERSRGDERRLGWTVADPDPLRACRWRPLEGLRQELSR